MSGIIKKTGTTTCGGSRAKVADEKNLDQTVSVTASKDQSVSASSDNIKNVTQASTACSKHGGMQNTSTDFEVQKEYSLGYDFNFHKNSSVTDLSSCFSNFFSTSSLFHLCDCFGASHKKLDANKEKAANATFSKSCMGMTGMTGMTGTTKSS